MNSDSNKSNSHDKFKYATWIYTAPYKYPTNVNRSNFILAMWNSNSAQSSRANQSIIHFIPLCKNKSTYICPQPSTKNKSIKRTKSWWHGPYPVLDKMLCSSLLYSFQWCWTIYCNSTTFLTTSATVVSKHSERTVGRRQIIYTVLGNFVLEPQK